MKRNSSNIVEVATKRRHLYLLEKVSQGKQLTPREIAELGQHEKKKNKQEKTVASDKDGKRSGAGRPPMFETPEQMQAAVDKFFDENEEPTVCGLTLALGFVSRQSLTDYKKKPEFADIIKKAKLRVEDSYEKELRGPRPTGSIFALKAMGWKEDGYEGDFETGPRRVKYSLKPPDSSAAKTQKAKAKKTKKKKTKKAS